MQDFTNPFCQKCERTSFCTYPCLNYSNYLIVEHRAKEDQKIQDSIKTLDSQISQAYKPTPTGVSEVDISVKSGVLCGCEKREKGEVNVSKNYELDEFMYNFIESSVDQDEYLQVVNGLVHPNKIVDWEPLLDYMKEQNRVYSEDNGLCEVCHSKLMRENQVEEYWGSRMVVAVNWVCPHGCN